MPVEPGGRVQGVLAAAEVLDPFPPIGRPAELAPGPDDELAERVTRLGAVRVGPEQVAQLLIGQPAGAVQGEREDQLALSWQQRSRLSVNGEGTEDADPQALLLGVRRLRRSRAGRQ